MKNILLSILILFFTIVANANPVEIMGIYYNLYSNPNTAEVTSNPDSYLGNVSIPSIVDFEGINYNVISIGNAAFANCGGLTSVTIPNSVVTIGKSAFKNCKSLTSVSLGENLTAIADFTFENCNNLNNVIIPNSVTSIGWSSFEDCSSMISVTIPNKVTFIGNSAFKNCSSLLSVALGNEVESISDYAFLGCSSLASLVIPSSVMSIAGGAFTNCCSLSLLKVDQRNPVFDSRNNCNAIIETASNTLILGCMNTVIPESVTSIEEGAFYGCIGLKSITIPNNVSSIGPYSFYGCSGLTSIVIPNGITTIERYAFSGCTNLTSFTIPGSVNFIDSYAFSGSNNIADFYCYAKSLPSTDRYSLNNIYYATLHVPAASLVSYQTIEPWKNFWKIVALEGDTSPIIEKCATPTISYVNGKLIFDCETEGAEFVYTISMAEAKTGLGNRVHFSDIVIAYRVSVYATKEGYANSNLAIKDIEYKALIGDANGDGEITISDAVQIVNTILGNNSIDNSQVVSNED